jgi:two-component system NtrC family response regulator
MPFPPEETLGMLLREQMEKVERLKEKTPRLTAWLNLQTSTKKVRPSVLLIDDDETIRKTLSHTLRAEGFRVDTAPDGSQALQKSRAKLYDVALIDVRLPDMEGTRLLSALREKSPEMKEIIMTGYPSVKNAVQAIDGGAVGYLIKPVDPSDLVAKIREKLGE